MFGVLPGVKLFVYFSPIPLIGFISNSCFSAAATCFVCILGFPSKIGKTTFRNSAKWHYSHEFLQKGGLLFWGCNWISNRPLGGGTDE